MGFYIEQGMFFYPTDQDSKEQTKEHASRNVLLTVGLFQYRDTYGVVHETHPRLRGLQMSYKRTTNKKSSQRICLNFYGDQSTCDPSNLLKRTDTAMQKQA